MNRIIQYVEEYLDKIFSLRLNGLTDLDATASLLTEDSKELSRNILQTIIDEMNVDLREDKSSRKEMGLVLHEKDRKRKLLTELGEIEFRRDYYYCKEDGRYEYPLDKMLSIQPRARIGETICAKLVTKATEESYGKSAADVTGGVVSRQTVRNKILEAPVLEKQPEGTKKRQVRVLDVYADEDHVHMQKPFKERGKKNKVVPLVTVTEGMRRVDERRNKTINPMHFVDEKMCAKELWASVEGYIDKAYDVEEITAIRIHADGGKWIANGLENFANVEHVMDGYHLQKELKKLDRRFRGKTVKYRLSKALEEDCRDKAELILAELYKDCKEETDCEAVQETQTYLLGNWEAAVNRYRSDVTGSCTEAQVSHVLSERFSRDPMGWSEEGLGKLSKLRVYCKNGGRIEAAHFKSTYKCDERYSEYARRYLEEQKCDYDLGWLSDMSERYVFDTASGTQQAIRFLGRTNISIFS